MTDNTILKQDPCWDGYVQRGMKPGDGGQMVPNCVPVSKADSPIVEGDFVSAMTTEGMIVGQVEHVMTEGGTYGEPGNPYAVESTPENPAVAIRMLEEEDGMYYYTPYSIGALMSNVRKIPMPQISMEDYEDMDSMDKADSVRVGQMVSWNSSGGRAEGKVKRIITNGSYNVPDSDFNISGTKESPAAVIELYRDGKPTGRMVGHKVGTLVAKSISKASDTYMPTDGMKAAARRALKFKEDGKATGAGTPVGWGRARDIVAGRAMSLSTVKRMYSFFSRHEVDKKGKDFNNSSNPSNGKIMWDAWGGDAGFSWSRAIVNRMKDKSLFAGFGTDYSHHDRVTEITFAKADSSIIPTQTRSQDAVYPGVGIKRPSQGKSGGTTGSKIKSQNVKKPKINRGRSGDALNSNGAIATTSGTSMGTKAEYMECTAESADCNDPMCKVCMNKLWDGSAFGQK